VASEPPETKKLYGMDDPVTETFGSNADRAAAGGTRRGMVQVYHTTTAKRSSCQLWDQHSGLKEELANNCAAVDKPIAGLLKDLKAQGLLEDTLVVWGGEFGRTPTAQGNRRARTSSFWLLDVAAGGGIKGGMAYGDG